MHLPYIGTGGEAEAKERGKDLSIPSPLRSTGLPWLLPIGTACLTLAAAVAACNPKRPS